MIIKNK